MKSKPKRNQWDRSVLVYAFFVIAVVVYFYDQSREGKLTVTTVPSGARISIDNQDYGKTPLNVTLKRGEYGIKAISEGYVPAEQKVVIEAGKTTTVEIQLKKAVM